MGSQIEEQCRKDLRKTSYVLLKIDLTLQPHIHTARIKYIHNTHPTAVRQQQTCSAPQTGAAEQWRHKQRESESERGREGERERVSG